MTRCCRELWAGSRSTASTFSRNDKAPSGSSREGREKGQFRRFPGDGRSLAIPSADSQLAIHETAACLGAVIFGGIHAETGDRTEGIEFLPPNHLTRAAMGHPVNSGRWLWEIA